MKIELRNLQRKYKVDERMIRGKAKAILSICGKENIDLGILIVNNKRMQALNKKYRGVDRPTDVLAFPLGPGLLGDIVISMEKVDEQAKEAGHSTTTELLSLLTHGILHLLGYDHEISPLEEKRMRRKENFILARI